MSALDTVKDIARIGSTAGLSKDVIDLLEMKSVLLTEQVSALERENAQLRSKIVELNQKLQHLHPVTHGLTQEDISALIFLDTAGSTVYPKQVAAALSIIETRAIWLLDRLTEREMARCRPVLPHSYFITQKGRDVVHNPTA